MKVKMHFCCSDALYSTFQTKVNKHRTTITTIMAGGLAMFKRKLQFLIITILIVILVIPSYISFVSSSAGNIKINTQGTSIPGQQVTAGGNVNLYFGSVTWDSQNFNLFLTQDNSSTIGSGLVYTPMLSVYDVNSATPVNVTGEYGNWIIGNNWINGSIPSTSIPGNYYIKAADQIGSVAVTETYITIAPISYNSVLNISPSSGPGGIPITLTGSQWPANGEVQIEYQDPYFGTWNLFTSVTANSNGNINITAIAPDLMRSIGSYSSPETYTSISFRARTTNGQFSTAANYNEYQRGLTQVGTEVPYGLYGNGTDLVSTVRVEKGDTLVIAGKWFYSNSPITIRWDSTDVVETISSNQWLSANVLRTTVASSTTGSFNTTVTIPDAVAGQHYIAVEDSQTRLTIKIFLTTGSLQIVPYAGPGGAIVQFSGSGYPASSTVDLSYYDLQFGQYRYWTSTISSATGDLFFTTEIPDLMQTSYAGDYNFSTPITFRTEVNATPYAYTDYIQNARGLQQVGTRVAFSLFGNGTNLSADVRPKPGDNLNISGKWFHPGIVYIKLDSVNVIGTIYGNEWASSQVLGSTTATQTGSFQTSVKIPIAIGGVHAIAIEDQDAKLIVNIYIDGPATLPTPTPVPSSTPSPTINPTTNPTPTPTPQLPSPIIELSCKSTSSNELNVQITGQLSLNGNLMAEVPVLLSYSVTGGTTWVDLTLVNTNSDGQFKAVWQPTVTGNYLIKATVAATSTMNAANKIINLAITPDAENNVFTLNSNSTITQFTFDPEKKELSFTASGPSQTQGYVNIYIPKSIMSDISGLKAYVDGNQVAFQSEAQMDLWLISFSYSHSTHHITMTLGSAQTVTVVGSIEWLYIVIPIAIIVIVALAIVILRRKQK
jgi:hypothetical protein